jgi:hypothetical protein
MAGSGEVPASTVSNALERGLALSGVGSARSVVRVRVVRAV